MSQSDNIFPHESVTAPHLVSLALPLFTATTFLSALLLFAIEPMFTKMALPMLGGSPSVWSLAMVFFQALMLAGYSYAHVLTRWLPARAGALIHFTILALAVTSLPIAIHMNGNVPPGTNPTLWLLQVFGISIGLPFFALSAQGPLLQAWFARTSHRQASDPYFLYAASNTGSLVALIAYPFLIEPFFGLQIQARAITVLFLSLTVLIAASAALSLARPADPASKVRTWPVTRAASSKVDLRSILAWAALSFVPSALLISVTVHISMNIAAAPLLWVVPLAIYLLTFVLTFRQRSFLSDTSSSMLLAWTGALALATLGLPTGSIGTGVAIPLAAFFAASMMCNRRLYEMRPDPQSLTLFYFATSLGGALGGLFAGVIAPLIFSSLVEYPFLIVAALACRSAMGRSPSAQNKRHLVLVFVAVAGILLAGHLIRALTNPSDLALKITFGGLCALMLVYWRRAEATAFIGLAMALQLTYLPGLTETSESYRSFFGVSRVTEMRGGQFRVLIHGNTIHGAIRIRNPDGSPSIGRPTPATYYSLNGPIGDTIAAARATHNGLRHVSVVGLGTGTIACLLRPDEGITFYEIDPIVMQLAKDRSEFRYLSDCAPQARLVLGDARLTLAAQKEMSDIIVVDAFSSDAIPVHLLTKEALAFYLSKLDDHGLLVLHLSNNTMEFSGLVARAAVDLGLVTYIRRDLAVPPDDPDMRSASIVAVLARSKSDLGPLAREGSQWHEIQPDLALRPWTDDYSSILTAIAAKLRLAAR